MRKVTGIGGIFMSAKDPKALCAWYKRHLEIDVQDWGGAAFTWTDSEGNPIKGTTAWLIGPANSGNRYRGNEVQCGPIRTKGVWMRSKPKPTTNPATELISERIAELGGWRGETLARIRVLIREADPDVVEEWKWKIPVWSHDGDITTGETYESLVKLTFFKGAFLRDPAKLFHSSLEDMPRRAIHIHEGDEIDAKAFKELVRAAVALNASGLRKPARRK